MTYPLDIVVLGLSLTSSWGNGHATTYRALLRAIAERGHNVLFLERNVPWYAANRDLPDPPFGSLRLYENLAELRELYSRSIRHADLVIVGSYVPDAIEIARWMLDTARGVRAFYDIDTPVTLAGLARGDCEYLEPSLIPRFDLFLSFADGPTPARLEQKYGSPCARPLLCSVDPELYAPEDVYPLYDLGYLGTYSVDRQQGLNELLIKPAQRLVANNFIVAGPQFPPNIDWPANVDRIEHLPPDQHRSFYNRQRFALNVTRRDMVLVGYSASVRLFEAAACGTPVISDWWTGIDSYFTPNQEILLASSANTVLEYLVKMTEERRREIGEAARRRVLAEHTNERRAEQLEEFFEEAVGGKLHRHGQPLE